MDKKGQSKTKITRQISQPANQYKLSASKSTNQANSHQQICQSVSQPATKQNKKTVERTKNQQQKIRHAGRPVNTEKKRSN